MGLFGSKEHKKLNWIEIHSLGELENAMNGSKEKKALFFKHSTRCAISKMTLNRFENHWTPSESIEIYYIDLLKHRDVSNALSEWTAIEHQSPQAILWDGKKVLYHASHSDITAEEIQKMI